MAAPRFALGPLLDRDALAARFARDGRLQIEDFLSNDAAEALRGALAASPDWRNVLNAGSKVFESARRDFDAMTASQREAIDQAVRGSAAHGFQFRYDRIRVADVDAERAARGTWLDDFARFMSAPATLAWLGEVTGIPDIRFADAQATLYRAGDFLTCHDDAADGKGRRLAYVLGLTRGWPIDWGGLLHFHDAKGSVTQTIVPRFNALSLFTVPQPHSVSYVAPFAQESRLSVTGWLRDGPPP